MKPPRKKTRYRQPETDTSDISAEAASAVASEMTKADVLRHMQALIVREYQVLPPDERITAQKHATFLKGLSALLRRYSELGADYEDLLVLRCLAAEAERVADGQVGMIFKGAEQVLRTPDKPTREQYQAMKSWYDARTGGQRQATLIQALKYAKQSGTSIPDWLSDILIDAGADVWDSGNTLTFNKALKLKLKAKQFAVSTHRNTLIANLVHEARNAGLTKADAIELTQYEVYVVLGHKWLEATTVDTYGRKHLTDGLGFSTILELTFRDLDLARCHPSGGHLLGAIDDVIWRKEVLARRLRAYRESETELQEGLSEKDHKAHLFERVSQATIERLLQLRPDRARLL